MAQVTSLTADRIMELASEWSGVPVEQEELRALITWLQQLMEQNSLQLTELNEETLPQLRDELATNDNKLSELNETVLPGLQEELEQNALELENIREVTLPNLQIDLAAEIENTLVRPKVYAQEEEPTNPDEDERDLVVGDTWFDTSPDADNKQRIWTGAEWSDMAVNIADFSLTVRKFQTSKHQIY